MNTKWRAATGRDKLIKRYQANGFEIAEVYPAAKVTVLVRPEAEFVTIYADGTSRNGSHPPKG